MGSRAGYTSKLRGKKSKKRQKSNIVIDLMLTVTRKSDEMESIMPYQHVILYFLRPHSKLNLGNG